MTFYFQLRFRCSSEINCDEQAFCYRNFDLQNPLKMIAQDSNSLRKAKWLLIQGSGYLTPEEARSDGLQLHKMLLVSIVEDKSQRLLQGRAKIITFPA